MKWRMNTGKYLRLSPCKLESIMADLSPCRLESIMADLSPSCRLESMQAWVHHAGLSPCRPESMQSALWPRNCDYQHPPAHIINTPLLSFQNGTIGQKQLFNIELQNAGRLWLPWVSCPRTKEVQSQYGSFRGGAWYTAILVTTTSASCGQGCTYTLLGAISLSKPNTTS